MARSLNHQTTPRYRNANCSPSYPKEMEKYQIVRPIYHWLLQKYNFQESDNEKPWYQQKPPSAVMKNKNATILWVIPFQLQKAPENEANKIDMAVYYDKQTNTRHSLKALSAKLAHLLTKHLRKRKHTQSYVQASNNFTKAEELQKSILFLTFLEATIRS